jgi:hypothetical protein
MRGKVPVEKWNVQNSVSEAKKKKKCKCNWLYCDPECTNKSHRYPWAFAPFYGKGDGKSDAAISTGTRSSGSSGGGAYPGAGGINMPGVPAGPNSGMGPITMSRDNFNGQAINEDLQLISMICEGN